MPQRPIISVLQGVLAFAGACIAGYVYVEKTRVGDVPCMVSGYSGCTAVANSAYSHIGPLDLSLLGAVAYVAILLLAVIKATSVTVAFTEKPAWLIAVLSTFGFVYSWYLQYVAKFILGRFCINCRLSAIAMTLLFLLSVVEITLMRRSQLAKSAPADYDPSI